jgi:hypothetical protein
VIDRDAIDNQANLQSLNIHSDWLDSTRLNRSTTSINTLSDRSTQGEFYSWVGLDAQQSDPWVFRLNYCTGRLEGELKCAAPSVGRPQLCRGDMFIHHALTLANTLNGTYPRGVDQLMEEGETETCVQEP